jgi:aspartyl-tRNA synthetase
MAHSVTITTPRLTWDEIVQQYGLSKADQKFVASLFDEKTTRRSTANASMFETKRSSNRKTKNRARKAA